MILKSLEKFYKILKNMRKRDRNFEIYRKTIQEQGVYQEPTAFVIFGASVSLSLLKKKFLIFFPRVIWPKKKYIQIFFGFSRTVYYPKKQLLSALVEKN